MKINAIGNHSINASQLSQNFLDGLLDKKINQMALIAIGLVVAAITAYCLIKLCFKPKAETSQGEDDSQNPGQVAEKEKSEPATESPVIETAQPAESPKTDQKEKSHNIDTPPAEHSKEEPQEKVEKEGSPQPEEVKAGPETPKVEKREPEEILADPKVEPTTVEVEKDDPLTAEEKEARDPHVRNVLLVGRSRSGKSSFLNVLKDMCHIVPPLTLFYTTREPVLTELKIADYTLRVLDTPGLFEQASVDAKEPARTNEELVALIKKIAQEIFGGKDFENVDTIIFTASFETGINPNDVDAMNIFLPELPKETKKHFVITRADNHTDLWREAILEDLPKHKQLKALIENHFGGIDNVLFSSALDVHKNINIEDGDDLHSKIVKVFHDRERLIEFLLPEKEEKDAKERRKSEIIQKAKAFIKAYPYPNLNPLESTYLTAYCQAVEPTLSVGKGGSDPKTPDERQRRFLLIKEAFTHGVESKDLDVDMRTRLSKIKRAAAHSAHSSPMIRESAVSRTLELIDEMSDAQLDNLSKCTVKTPPADPALKPADDADEDI